MDKKPCVNENIDIDCNEWTIKLLIYTTKKFISSYILKRIVEFTSYKSYKSSQMPGNCSRRGKKFQENPFFPG